MDTDYSANVSLWLNCNLKCPYCFGNPLRPPREWTTETAENLIRMEDFLNATGSWELDFSGGEPTIYPGFSDFCMRLTHSGHQVMFYSNGVKSFSEIFSEESAAALKRVTFSYQVAHEKSSVLDRMFERNVSFLKEHGVEVAVNYVLYPDRNATPAAVRKRMEDLDVDLQFRAFQGEFRGRQYPFAYSRAEIDAFAEVGDIRARFLMEQGYFIPTFKKCRAGQETFYVSLRTGGVYVCEQLQQKELANFLQDSAADKFLGRVRTSPISCPAKRCTCRITVEQEAFLANNDPWDMDNYPAWKEISLPSSRARKYWDDKEQAFARELAGRLQGDRVYLWGGGVHSLILLRLLKNRGFPLASIRGVIDSNPLRQGEEILGIGILSAEDVGWRRGNNCSDILISSRAFEDEIFAEIQAHKVPDVNVIRLYDGSMKYGFEALETY